MALPMVYPAPTDGSVPAGTAWVSDICGNCGRTHLLTAQGLQSKAPVGADAIPPAVPGPTLPPQPQIWYTCQSPSAPTSRTAIFVQIGSGIPAAVTTAIGAGNTWSS